MTTRRAGTKIIEVGRAVGRGANDAAWGTAEVLVKGNARHGNVVLNEVLANRLGLLTGLPVPIGDVSTDGQWVVGAIRRSGYELPPPSHNELLSIRPADRALTLAFDSWIGNIDRSADNILFDSPKRVWLLDHDQAFFGDISRDRAQGLLSTRTRGIGGHHVFADGPLRPGPFEIDAALNVIRGVSLQSFDPHLERCVVAQLLTVTEADAVRTYLSGRQKIIRSLAPRDADPSQTPVLPMDGTLWEEVQRDEH